MFIFFLCRLIIVRLSYCQPRCRELTKDLPKAFIVFYRYFEALQDFSESVNYSKIHNWRVCNVSS